MLKKIGALCALVVVVCVLFVVAPAAAYPHVAEGGRSGGGGSSCSYEKGGTCDPANLEECLEDCAYWHGREIETCSRMRDKKKREACYAKANEKHAQCRRDCAKKFPEK